MARSKIKVIVLLITVVTVLIVIALYPKNNSEGIIKRYDPSTKSTHIFHYVLKNEDTILHGKSVQYNEKGDKLSEGNFVNGQTVGKWVYYFDNGNAEVVHYRLKNKVNAESIWNYPNGEIERYIMFDEFNQPVFILRYDEQGNVKNYEGYALIEVYQYKFSHPEKFKIKTTGVLKVGDTLKHKYLLANIPNAKQNLRINIIDPDYLGYKSNIIKKPPVGIDAADILTKKGVYSIKGVVEYKFNDVKKTVIKDSIYFEVKVN